MSLDRVASLFQDRYGSEPELVVFAPGRVNLIGEHTDYSDGFVFPAALHHGVWLAASRSTAESEVVSAERGPGQPFDVVNLAPASVEGWAGYVAGVAWALRTDGAKIPNLQIAIAANLPIGAALSSSAALEVASALAWSELAGLHLSKLELAQYGQASENRFVGVQCGIMDQMASAFGERDSALFMDIRSLEVEPIRIPPWLRIVVCDTRKRRALRTSEYNSRRMDCEAACRILGIERLRDADVAAVESAQSELGEVVFRRALHVVTENERCLAFRGALARGDKPEIGELMRLSHESLAFDFEVSCPELDSMAAACRQHPACVGARMTGGGFGGACIALVEVSGVESFLEGVPDTYHKETGIEGRFLRCRAGDGARVLTNL